MKTENSSAWLIAEGPPGSMDGGGDDDGDSQAHGADDDRQRDVAFLNQFAPQVVGRDLVDHEERQPEQHHAHQRVQQGVEQYVGIDQVHGFAPWSLVGNAAAAPARAGARAGGFLLLGRGAEQVVALVLSVAVQAHREQAGKQIGSKHGGSADQSSSSSSPEEVDFGWSLSAQR